MVKNPEFGFRKDPPGIESLRYFLNWFKIDESRLGSKKAIISPRNDRLWPFKWDFTCESLDVQFYFDLNESRSRTAHVSNPILPRDWKRTRVVYIVHLNAPIKMRRRSRMDHVAWSILMTQVNMTANKKALARTCKIDHNLWFIRVYRIFLGNFKAHSRHGLNCSSRTILNL